MVQIVKRRRVEQPAEITFDPAARQDYLTGFHTRKQQRIKVAREEALKREKGERVQQRRELREQRKEDLEKHVAEVNAVLRDQNGDASEAESRVEQGDEWDGIAESERANAMDEYVDEDKYTTVTVEPMGEEADSNNEEDGDEAAKAHAQAAASNKVTSKTQSHGKSKHADGKPKVKKKKFRYESKAERKVTREKQKRKNSASAKARRNES